MAKMFKEEHELNELSPGTLGSYINKAHNRSKFLSVVRDQNHGRASTSASPIDRDFSRKINNADIGIRRATDRLTSSGPKAYNTPKKKERFLGQKTIAPNPEPSQDKDINPRVYKPDTQQHR